MALVTPVIGVSTLTPTGPTPPVVSTWTELPVTSEGGYGELAPVDVTTQGDGGMLVRFTGAMYVPVANFPCGIRVWATVDGDREAEMLGEIHPHAHATGVSAGTYPFHFVGVIAGDADDYAVGVEAEYIGCAKFARVPAVLVVEELPV